MGDLGAIRSQRFTGSERFHDGKRAIGFSLLDYWQWSASDLVSNTSRGVVAEFLVASAIGIAGGVREEWAAYDLESPDGIRIEVKSSAYLQGWRQADYSKVMFSCKKSHGWDRESGQMSDELKRQADVYVFCLLAHRQQETLDLLDVSQWEFYVLPTVELDSRTRSQRSITLRSLQALAGAPVPHSGLGAAIHDAAIVQHATCVDSTSTPAATVRES